MARRRRRTDAHANGCRSTHRLARIPGAGRAGAAHPLCRRPLARRGKTQHYHHGRTRRQNAHCLAAPREKRRIQRATNPLPRPCRALCRARSRRQTGALARAAAVGNRQTPARTRRHRRRPASEHPMARHPRQSRRTRAHLPRHRRAAGQNRPVPSPVRRKPKLGRALPLCQQPRPLSLSEPPPKAAPITSPTTTSPAPST